MAILTTRQELRRRAADSLTLPDFDALTSLDPGNGHYLSLEARIEDTSIPVSMELQRVNADEVDYELRWGMVEYQGTISLAEVCGEFESQVTLDRFNGKRVYAEPDGKKGARLMYRQGTRTSREGTPAEIGSLELKAVAYWVPTIINHIAKNVDYFLRGLKEDAARDVKEETALVSNMYHLEAVPQQDTRQISLPSAIDHSHASPSAHYRRSHERTLETEADTITVRVTGAYVNVNWKEYSTEQVVASVREHASDIFCGHFEEHILPQIVKGGHSYQKVREAYHNGRVILQDEVKVA